MHDHLDGKGVASMIVLVAEHLIDNTDRLTDADIAIGDGDHGTGMRRGFEGVLKSLAGLDEVDPEIVLKKTGSAIMTDAGGASGAIFGTLFRSGSKALAGRPDFDAAAFADFLGAGLASVERRGQSAAGQKTMIDALSPAAKAAEAHRTGSLGAAVAAAAEAALDGMEQTKAMVAKMGKARSLGDRSLGHVDPGALSMSLILDAMNAFLKKRRAVSE
jgi:dihydroxyacetone kinase-like protein